MKRLTVIIERNEDAYFAYVKEIDGCTAGGYSYSEVKSNIIGNIDLALAEDDQLHNRFKNGYELQFEVNLQSFFKLIPEINISQLANMAGMNPGLLRQYVSGSKPASESQVERINQALAALAVKLRSFNLLA